MNSYQIVFLIFSFLPIISSISIDKLTGRMKDLRWAKWSDSIFVMYLFEIMMIGLMLVYLLLGDL